MNTEFLRNVTIFNSLSTDELDLISKICIQKTFVENEFLFNENDSGNELYIIESGNVEILKSTVADQMKSLTILKEGDFLGEFSLFNDFKRSANAKSITKAIIYSIGKDDFNKLLESNHSLGYKIMKNMVQQIGIRLNKTNQKFQEHVFWGLTSLM
jgi:CRP/FNR family transcriptional regulator